MTVDFENKLADFIIGTVATIALAGIVITVTSGRPSLPDPTPSPYPTDEPTATVTPIPTRTPFPTPTQILLTPGWYVMPLDPEPMVLCDSVGSWCLVRAGPGKEYEIVARYPPGANLLLDDLNPGGDWYVVELPDGSLAYASKEVWR